MYLEVVKKYKTLYKDVASKTWVLQLKRWNVSEQWTLKVKQSHLIISFYLQTHQFTASQVLNIESGIFLLVKIVKFSIIITKRLSFKCAQHNLE